MKAVFRVGLAALALLVLWAVVVFVGTSEGWWKQTLAPRGDIAGFMDAAAKLVDSSNTGNAVFAVIDDGTVHGVHAVSVGEAVDVNTVFQTASLSKWISAWGVMALVQEGKLDLDAPVSTYLTRWALPESKFDNNKVTVRRLLSHTAGLTDGLGYAGFAPNAAVQSLEESLKRPADASPGASGAIEVGYEPGSEWRYSGGGYAILQLLIEEVSGESFEGFMQRVIFRPLGMVRSSYSWTPAEGSTLATFYDVDSKPSTHYRFAAVAATSLYTSVSDLTRFVQAHLPGKNGEPIGRGVLGPAIINEMWRPHASKFSEDIWGLGTILYASNNKGGFVVGHDGNNEPAINTAARLNPATGNGIVILETGQPLLATRLAGEWVFWETGNVDFLAFTIAIPGMLRLIGLGSLVIVLAVPTIAWSIRHKRRSRSVNASASKVALGLGLLLLLGCRAKNMAMTPKQLNEFAIRYTAAWCSHEPQRVPEFFAEHGSLTINRGVPAVGRAAIATAVQGFMTAFPDLVVVMDSLETAGPTIRYYWTLTGTNTGPGGTGRPVHISGYEEWTFGPDGRVAQSRGHFDEAAYRAQLQGTAEPAS